jgi:DNA-binding CsgD family transcriptional regulator
VRTFHYCRARDDGASQWRNRTGDDDLIAAIYDAIIDPSRWDEVVKRIVEATKSFSGNLVLQQVGAGNLTALYNVDPVVADAYAQTYYKNDPLRTPAWSLAPGEVRVCSYTQTEWFKASAYYDEFVRPQGWANLVATGLARTCSAFSLLALTRSPDAIWVEPAEWQLLQTLAPHLQRAAAIHDLLSRTRATTNSLGAAVAAAGFAVFLLTEDCRVVFANAKAEDLVRRQMGLRYALGRLAAATPALTARLHALARHGSWPGRAEGDVCGSLELRSGDCPPLLAHVIPLAASRAAAVFDIDRPAAAVFVVDPAAGLGAQIERFAARFGLTIAETRVLGEIIGGNGLLAAATKLKITEATARSHANHILAKTGTCRRQSSFAGFLKPPCPAWRPAPKFFAKI